MNCPKCKDKGLRKEDYDSPNYCKQCGGMWLEFEKIPGFFEKLGEEASGEIAKNSNDEKAGFCPNGHGLMTRAKVENIENPFYLEKCSSCGGVWFDNEEWRRIAENNLANNINDFWCTSWQAQQRKMKTRASYLETNKRLLGNDIFEKIIDLSKLLKDHPDKGRAVALLQQEIL